MGKRCINSWKKAKCGGINLGICLYLVLFALLLLYGHILQPTSDISFTLSQVFFHALLKSSSHTHVGSMALPLSDDFKNTCLLFVLNVCQIVSHMY